MEYARKIYDRLLQDMISYRSISTDKSNAQYVEGIEGCALWLESVFIGNNFDTHVIDGYGNPIVVARYDAGKEKTCLIYGHYDVQPAELSDGWKSEPFKVTERDGRLYARGATDNKGQIAMHVASVISLIAEGKLDYNVVFMIEGDEESGNGEMKRFIEDHRDLLKCDFVLISDGEGIGNDPSFEISFRGVFNVEIKIKTADNDQHSGLYGGIMCSAAHCAGMFLNALEELQSADTGDHPLYVGYKSAPSEVLDLAPPFDLNAFEAHTGGHLSCPLEMVTELLGFEPCIEVTGIASGYVGNGFRNAIPAEATIKLNVRVAPTQDAKACARSFERWVGGALVDVLPIGAMWEVNIPVAESGVMLWGKENPYFDRARTLVADVIGKPASLRSCGASIPVVTHFDRMLGVPQILLSLGNQDCNMHGVDENITLVCVEQGLTISRRFLSSDSAL